MTRRARGRVVLVGAGPGDPELITVKGLGWLRRADVVVYDRLADRALLDEAPRGAELIDAGKAPGRHTLDQEAINAVLIARALAGKTVIRLKGGDPGIFARAAEELGALRAAGVGVEVVPGVTAATAAAARAGFSLTDREHVSTVVLTTGSVAGDREAGPSRWTALAGADGTLVFYMPVRSLVSIVDALLEGGRAPGEPALLLQGAWTPRERQLFAPLERVAARARELELQAPAILIVGAVVAQSPGWVGAAAGEAVAR